MRRKIMTFCTKAAKLANGMSVLRNASCKYSSVSSEKQASSLTKTFTQDDVRLFAELTGDSNPLHLDEAFATRSRFGKCVVHGALINGLVSAVIGTRLPGNGSIVAKQQLDFPNSLLVGERVTATVSIDSKRHSIVYCSFICTTDNNVVVLEGKATLVVSENTDNKTAL